MHTAVTTILKRVALVSCIGGAGLAASGCTSTLSTTVAVTGSSATITVTLNLDGDAAAVIARTPSLQTELNQVLTVRMKKPEHISVTPALVSWTGTLSYRKLMANSDVLGVGALSTSSVSSGVRVDVGIVDPTGLDAALAFGGKGEKDAAALLVTMEHYTNLSLTISFPGTATLVSYTGPRPQVSSNAATLTQALYNYRPGGFIVDGTLSTGLAWYYWAGGIAVLAGLVVVLGRRRR